MIPSAVAQAPDQSKEISKEEFITACARYRSEVIHGITYALIDFNLLVDSLKRESKYPQGHEKIRGIVTSKLLELVSDEEDGKKHFASFSDIQIEPIHRASYLEWLMVNEGFLYEYNVLAGQEIIDSDYPYKLASNTFFWQELQFYQIKDEMTLVDVGTGIGHFPIIIAMAGFEGKFYVTEIDSQQISIIRKKLHDFELDNSKSNLVIVHGKLKNVALGDVKADKIFFRDTFHHLKYKKDILESLKKHLKEDGFVYVLESVKDLVTDKKNACSKIVYKDRILSEFKDLGFTLDNEIQIGEQIIFKFSL
jgi:ubiquinone/menaquinone biosynthesis C-methylase UbiE